MLNSKMFKFETGRFIVSELEMSGSPFLETSENSTGVRFARSVTFTKCVFLYLERQCLEVIAGLPHTPASLKFL